MMTLMRARCEVRVDMFETKLLPRVVFVSTRGARSIAPLEVRCHRFLEVAAEGDGGAREPRTPCTVRKCRNRVGRIRQRAGGARLTSFGVLCSATGRDRRRNGAGRGRR